MRIFDAHVGDLDNPSRVIKRCIKCYKMFRLFLEYSKKHDTLYCSLECSGEGTVEKKCTKCGKTFVISRARDREKNIQRCSRECRKNRGELSCLNCGKKFYRTASIINSGIAKYCSRRCVAIGTLTGKKKNFSSQALENIKARGRRVWPKGHETWNKGLAGKNTYSEESKTKMRAHRLTQKLPRRDTIIEKLMKEALDKDGIKYESQYKLGSMFVCDFAIPDKKIIIECDGEYWHNQPNNIRCDKNKADYCKTNGWRLLRFSDKEIKEEIKACIARVWASILLQIY